ncbi:hypothetical protein RyT2_21460 [Pseudolactococcus yaeyamensis]
MGYNIENFLQDFASFIESKQNLDKKYLTSTSSYNGFEKLIEDESDNFLLSITEIIIKHDIVIEPKFNHHFPDLDVTIDDIKYGVELKSRKDGSWVNNGGSVFESISDSDYQEIYVMFGTFNEKKGDRSYQVRYAPYWQVTQAIKVTHKPRYFLNMNAETTVFKTADEYDELRNLSELDKNKFVQKILSESATKPQWYISQNSVDDSEHVNPIQINKLEKSQRDRIIAELLILYPQDLLTDRANYSRSTEYLINSYFYYTSSLRDLFTAGGKFTYENVEFPKVVGNLRNLSADILSVITTQTDDFKELAYQSWNDLEIKVERNDFLQDYKKVIDYLGKQNFSQLLNSVQIEKISEIIF